MSRLPPQNSFLQPESSRNSHQVPQAGSRFQSFPQWNRFQPPPAENRFRAPPPGNGFQPPTGNGFQPPPRGNGFQPPPRGNGFQPPPPGNRYQPPPGNGFQHPPPGNGFRPLPPGNGFQHPPPGNRFQHPTVMNMFLPPPPPRNMLQHSLSSNLLQQPPPSNVLQQPPPSNLLQQPPTKNMLEHLPSCMLQPPPNLSQRPSTSTLSQPSPHHTSSVPPQHSTESETSDPVSAPRNISRLASLEPPPPGPSSRAAACVAAGRPPSLRSEHHVPLSFVDRRRPPPAHRGRDVNGGVRMQSPADVASSASSGPSMSARSLDRKSFPMGQISNKDSSYGGLGRTSSVQLPEHHVENVMSANTTTKMSVPLGNTTGFCVPPPPVPGKTNCSVSVDAYLRVPPPDVSFRAPLPKGSIGRQPTNEPSNCSSASLIDIPRHPLNINYVSSTKLQCRVDEWVFNKLNIGKKITVDPDIALSSRGQLDDSLEAKKFGMSDQGPENLKKILEESDIHGSNSSLLSSVLPLLSKPYRDFRLLDVHRCVAAYKILLEELRGDSDEAQHAAIKKLLDPVKCILSDQKFQDLVKKLVSARGKKRQRKKNRKLFLKREWDRKGKLIDARREELHRLEQQKLQEARLRSEVDDVLKEVRGKQEEAASLQSLLWTLRDLRQHRLNRGEQQGYVSSQRDDDRFSRVTDGLEKMVETQLSDYALEERTLQAMLQSGHPPAACASHAATQSEVTVPGISASVVEELLFGACPAGDDALYASYCAADTSFEMLVTRRRAWDEHIVSNTDNSSAEGGSGVPLCWVLPPSSPTLPWRQYLAS